MKDEMAIANHLVGIHKKLGVRASEAGKAPLLSDFYEIAKDQGIEKDWVDRYLKIKNSNGVEANAMFE